MTVKQTYDPLEDVSQQLPPFPKQRIGAIDKVKFPLSPLVCNYSVCIVGSHIYVNAFFNSLIKSLYVRM